MAREKVEEDEDEGADSNAWMITFSDLLTLMITFFVLLLTMSTMEKVEVMKIFGKLITEKVILESGNYGEISIMDDIVLKDLVDADTELDILKEFLEVALENEEAFDPSEIKGEVDKMVSRNEDGMVVTVTDSILFETGESELSYFAYPLLKALGRMFLDRENKIEIKGHSDSSGGSSSSANWIISAKRANSVLLFFTETSGINIERMTARGSGAYAPIVANNSPENRAKNRRVEIILKDKI